MLKFRIGLSAAALSLVAGAAAQTTSLNFTETYAIVGARVEIGDGSFLPKGTVVMRGNKILAVGPDIQAPAYAYVIDGKGLVVYPGFIDAFCTQGLKVPTPQPNQDVPPAVNESPPVSMREANRKGISPEVLAARDLDLSPELLSGRRGFGFTSAVFAPTGGMINGAASLVNLSGLPARDSVLDDAVGEDFAFRFMGNDYPATLMGVFPQVRQTLLDAQRYAVLSGQRGTAAYKDPSLEALQPLLGRTLPVLFEVDSSREVTRAVGLAQEFGLDLVLVGAREAYKKIAEIKAAHASVILSLNFAKEPKPKPAKSENKKDIVADDLEPKALLESREAEWTEAVSNALHLQRAQIPYAITAIGCQSPAEFWGNVRRLIGAGLSEEEVVKALTSSPAEIFGMGRQLGTVASGKMANLSVFDGRISKEGSKPRYLFIGGRLFETDKGEAPPPQGGGPGNKQEGGDL